MRMSVMMRIQTIPKMIRVNSPKLIIKKLKIECNATETIIPVMRYIFLIVFDLKYEKAIKIPIIADDVTCSSVAPTKRKLEVRIALEKLPSIRGVKIKKVFSSAAKPRAAVMR